MEVDGENGWKSRIGFPYPKIWIGILLNNSSRSIKFKCITGKIGEDGVKTLHDTLTSKRLMVISQIMISCNNIKKWSTLWGRKQWPKITLFLWLVMHGKILTWDNLW